MAVTADEFFGRPTEELIVAGITGTSGKTTTSFLLAAILEAAGLRPGMIGTIETRIGRARLDAVRTTPEAIDLQRSFRAMLDGGDRSCTLEATSHGSQLRRLDRVRFGCLVFTNLSQDHLDLHGTMEEYFQAKRRLFMETRPPAAINIGDSWGRRLAVDLPDALTYGLEGSPAIGREALDGDHPRVAWEVQRRERAGRRGRGTAARGRRPRDHPGAGIGEGRARPVRACGRGPAVRSDRGLLAQARRPRERPAGRRATCPPAVSSASSAAAATATARNGR